MSFAVALSKKRKLFSWLACFDSRHGDLGYMGVSSKLSHSKLIILQSIIA